MSKIPLTQQEVLYQKSKNDKFYTQINRNVCDNKLEEAKKANNSNLQKAKKAKNDEFYTYLSDVEKEVKNYRKHFKDKIIYCNCDDPEWSNFFKYFTNAFDLLGLKKVITTHYKKDGGKSYKLELSQKGTIIKTDLEGNGDFRSAECIEILKEADILITNPPFSLFREYVSRLMKYNKKFLIIGSNNAITYKETFQFIKENKLWQGINSVKEFKQPDGSVKKFGNICWYTNLEHKKRDEKLIMFKTYKNNEKDYLKYEDCDAIEVSKTKEIPYDYEGVMGVPITFMDKYNPEQFEIINCLEPCISLINYKKKEKFKDILSRQKIYNKIICQKTYHRLLIKNKNPIILK